MATTVAGTPHSFPSRSAPKMQASASFTAIQRKASLMSFLARRILTPGKRTFHQSITLANSSCLGWSAGGWSPLGHIRFGKVPSQISLPSELRVLSGFCFGTRAIETLMTCLRMPSWVSVQTKTLPLAASFQNAAMISWA